MQLKKICNHPFLFTPVDEGMMKHLEMDLEREWAGPDLWRASGKFELLTRVLPKMQASGHRVLMFCQFTTTMDVLEWFFKDMQINYLRLDGATRSEARGNLIEMFNAPGSKFDLFVLSTRAGGLGLNLQSADTVIIFDSDWNPHQDLQAQDRAHRIGQKNEVRVLRILTVGTIEEFVLETAQFKLEMDDKVIQAGKYNAKSSADESTEYLRRALAERSGAGEDDADKEKGDEEVEAELPTDDHLNRMLARSDEEFEQFQRLDEIRTASEQAWRSTHRKSRLMEMHELPPWVMRTDADVAFEVTKHSRVDLELVGQQRRSRRDVTYAAVSDREFNRALQNGDADEWDHIQQGGRRTRKRGRGEDGDADDLLVATARKRSVRPVAPRTVSLTPIVKILIAAMQNAEVNGRSVSAAFMKDPSRNSAFPNYQLYIAKPMSLKKINDKRSKGRYKTIEKLEIDMQLMLDNAILYRQTYPATPGIDQMVADGEHLMKVFREEWVKANGGPKESEPEPEPTVDGGEGGGGGSSAAAAAGGVASMSGMEVAPPMQEQEPPPLSTEAALDDLMASGGILPDGLGAVLGDGAGVLFDMGM